MSALDRIAADAEAMMVQEIKAYGHDDYAEHRALPEFRSAFVMRLCESLGATYADGLAVQLAPACGWREVARRDFLEIVGDLVGFMDGIRLTLEAHCAAEEDLRDLIVAGFTGRLAGVASP